MTTIQPTVTPPELSRSLTASSRRPRIIDVRTPAEFESAHIAGAVNVPLDVVETHAAGVAEALEADDAVLVCRSGQRATQAESALRRAGYHGGRVLDDGMNGWESRGFNVERGRSRWELERQVRLVAGSVVLGSVLASTAYPRLKWVAAGIGGGLTFAALSDTCAMASGLSKLPYNAGPRRDAGEVVAALQRRPAHAG